MAVFKSITSVQWGIIAALATFAALWLVGVF